MNCAEFEVLLADYVDGNVTPEQRRAIDAHCDVCPLCRDLLRDVFYSVKFTEDIEEVLPPPDLVTRLVYLAPQGRIREEFESRGILSRAFTRWLQPVLQPRMAMGMAMTILSFAMLGRCTGIQVHQLKAADLSPMALWSNLEDKTYRGWDRTVKYYDNLRLVYEVETRVKEMRDQQDPGQTDAGAAGSDLKNNSPSNDLRQTNPPQSGVKQDAVPSSKPNGADSNKAKNREARP